MRWQDLVFTAGSVMFCVTLVPMLRAKTPPPLISSVPIALGLYVFAVTYLTLGFVLAPAIELVQAGLWTALAAQRALRQYAGAQGEGDGVRLAAAHAGVEAGGLGHSHARVQLPDSP